MNEQRKPDYSPGRWKIALSLTFLVGGLFLFYYYVWPHRNIGPEQPVPFSHRVHAGTKQIACRFCHPFPDRSQRAGLPEMGKCLFCHNYIIPNHPEILKDKATLATGRPLLWKRIFYVPDYVQFRHLPHMRWAGLVCTECHGLVETQDRLVPHRFQMGFCIDCHKRLGAQTDCWLACHH